MLFMKNRKRKNVGWDTFHFPTKYNIHTLHEWNCKICDLFNIGFVFIQHTFLLIHLSQQVSH